MKPSVTDLFGEVAITTLDIDAWLRAVPRMDPTTHRAAQYIRDWRVPEKVREAKLRGDFDDIVAPAETASEFWGTRFRW